MGLNIGDYVNFSKKERRGIYVLLLLVAGVFMAPALLPFFSKKKTYTADDTWRQLAQITVTKDTVAERRPYQKYDRQPYHKNYAYQSRWRDAGEDEEPTPGRLFYFDPNTLDAEGWQQLGIREKTALTIQNYTAKGGHFYKPEDIGRIYGLSKTDVERLLPWVQITPDTTRYAKTAFKNEERTALPTIVDVNTADTTALKALPGIGTWLAKRIVNFRDKLGGFYAVTQVAETRNLPDSTWQKIKDRLVCNPASIRKININTADTALLRAHPYIDKSLANNLVQYRNQHGTYHVLADLKKLALMRDDLFEKLLPYITIE
jgi:competence protein ComEA